MVQSAMDAVRFRERNSIFSSSLEREKVQKKIAFLRSFLINVYSRDGCVINLNFGERYGSPTEIFYI